MRLSVLICSLAARRDQLAALEAVLLSQVAAANAHVEVVANIDNGELTTGAKRNKLIADSHSEYLAFVDDDDMVSPGYVVGILDALRAEPDYVAMPGWLETPSGHRRPMLMTRQPKPTNVAGVYVRAAGHLNPVRRELVLQAGGFADMTCGEDADFGARLRPLIKTEAMPNQDLVRYIYRYDPAKSATHHAAGGLLYWNVFGGDWRFDAKVSAPEGLMVKIDGAPIAIPPTSRVHLQNTAGVISVHAGQTRPTVLRASYPATTHLVELSPLGRAKLLRLTNAVVSGRPTLLRYVRPKIGV